MFNCYDTILQQQQQRSRGSNKVWQGDASARRKSRAKKMGGVWGGGCGVQFGGGAPLSRWASTGRRSLVSAVVRVHPRFPAKLHSGFRGTIIFSLFHPKSVNSGVLARLAASLSFNFVLRQKYKLQLRARQRIRWKLIVTFVSGSISLPPKR